VRSARSLHFTVWLLAVWSILSGDGQGDAASACGWAGMLHAQIEDSNLAAQRQCPVRLFHKTHGHVPQPQLVLQTVLRVILAEIPPLPVSPLVFP